MDFAARCRLSTECELIEELQVLILYLTRTLTRLLLTMPSFPVNYVLLSAKHDFLRQGHFNIYDRGHTEGWVVDGIVKSLHARVVHDDWKSTASRMNAQSRYMSRELTKISNGGEARLRDRLRSVPALVPIGIFLYCLFGKGLIFDGPRRPLLRATAVNRRGSSLPTGTREVAASESQP